jgi:hypothetical protein
LNRSAQGIYGTTDKSNQTITAKEGGRLSYAENGDPVDKPVFQYHGSTKMRLMIWRVILPW